MEPPPSGLDVDLTHDGFHCTLAARTAGVDLVVEGAGLLALGAAVVVATVLLSATAGASLVAGMLGIPVAGALVVAATGGARAVARARTAGWRVEVDRHVLVLARVGVWTGRRVEIPLETIREVFVDDPCLVVHAKDRRLVLRCAAQPDALAWVAAGVRHAREQKVSFLRDLLSPRRAAAREALGRLTNRRT